MRERSRSADDEFAACRLPELRHPGRIGQSGQCAAAGPEAAAERLGIQVVALPVRSREDFDAAFATMVRERLDAFIAVPSPLIRSQRAALAELSLKHRMPGMFGPRENVEAGGLMSYYADPDDTTRRAASYIARILKGALPADLPVEQASTYELVVNLKTARARHQDPVERAGPGRSDHPVMQRGYRAIGGATDAPSIACRFNACATKPLAFICST